MKKSLLLIALLITAYNISFSQGSQHNSGFMQGYVVKANNDTLFGEVKFRNDNERMLSAIRYRKNKDTAIEYFSAADMRAFQLGRFTYIVHKGKYLQEISIGEKVDIYEARKHLYNTEYTGEGNTSLHVRDDKELSHIYLIKKNGDKIKYLSDKRLINKRRKARLTVFFKDAPNLISKIKQSYYTNADIIYMAYQYNEPGKYQLKHISKKEYKEGKRKR